MPIRFTIKEVDAQHRVIKTPDRSFYWEIQTPQIIETVLLKQGYEKAYGENLSVTDDVSLVELLGKPVKIVEGAYTNIKITTPDDLAVAETLYKTNG